MTALHDTIPLGYDLGWSFTPLSGKRPTLPGWQKRPRAELAETLSWADKNNVGLRTGAASGVVVIDLDDGADISALPHELPETVTVRTGSGTTHLYYTADRPLGNSAGRLGPHIDVRGDGGQVVYPGSIHPDTGRRYEFTKSPADTPLAPLPEWVYTYESPKPTVTERRIKRTDMYTRVALKAECNAVRSAAEGERNDTLNRAAFSLGTLVGAGETDRDTVEAELLSAAALAGLSERESLATITSGLNAGMDHPREIKPRAGTPKTPTPKSADSAVETILIPGAHRTDAGVYVEQSHATFASQVLEQFPDDLVYVKSNLPGELPPAPPGERRWTPLTEQRMRILIDEHARLAGWYTRRGGDGQVQVYKPCNKDLAAVTLAGAQGAPHIRRLSRLVSYPIYGPDFRRIKPGWQDGVYYDPPAALDGLEPERDLETIRGVLEELVCDFPFKDEASRQNFYGLLLTPIIAPAIDGNRPLHMIVSPLERTGKTKLAEEVFGGVILGRQTPAMQLTDRDEERDKRILALLLQGETLVHLDNLPVKVDSGALAALLTATTYQGRMLGATRMLSLENNLTLVGSGNNVQCSGEIAKRTVPIVLQPRKSHPEARRDFRYPNLRAHVSATRCEALAALLGMVENWLDQGRPEYDNRMGGFEGWSEAVGGILRVNGFNRWRSNESEWRRSSDTKGEELETFVRAWFARHGRDAVNIGSLLQVARDEGVFGWVFDKPTSRGVSTAFGAIMRRYLDAPIADWTIRRQGVGNHSVYHLVGQ